MEPPTNNCELPPLERSSQGSQHGMCLPLHKGEQTNNAFTSESSPSSSSTSLLYDRGETSPDSTRSLSSLSSARTDSPLDVDMPEAELGKAIANSDDSGIQSPDCRPDYGEDNDNSVSVYLDANEDCWSDNDNHNVTLVVTQRIRQTDDDNASLCSSENDTDDETKEEEDEEEDSFLSLVSVEIMMKTQVAVSALEATTSSDLETVLQDISEGPQEDVPKMTEVNETQREVVHLKGEVSAESPLVIQEADVMNEKVVSLENSKANNVSTLEETKNIVSSNLFNTKEDNQPKSNNQLAEVAEMDIVNETSLEEDTVLHISEGQPADMSKMASVNEAQREVVKEKEEVFVESSLVIQETNVINETVVSSENSEGDKISAPVASTRNTTSSHSSISKEDNQPKPTAKKTNDLAGRAHARTPTRAALTKATKPEAKRFPRPDLRNVKAKIISRAASTPRSGNPAKTSSTVNQTASGSVKVPARKVEDKAVGKRSRSSSSHARGNETKTCPSAEVSFSTGQEEDVNDFSMPTQGEETTMKSECLSSADFKIEGLEKDAGDKTSKSKTVSSKLGPSLGTNSAPTSGPPESRLKPSNRATGILGPPGGRALQPAGIPRMRSSDKSPSPCSPPSVSSSPCKTPQRPASSKLPVKGLPTSPSSSSLGSTISESNSPAVNKAPIEAIKNEEKSVKQSPASQIPAKSVLIKPVSGHRNRASSTPTKPAGVGLKAPAVTNHVTAKNNQNALQRSGSARLTRSTSVAVDKSSKGSKAAGPTAGRTPQQSPATQGAPTEEEEERDLRLQNEKKSQCILHLRKLIVNGNRRLEALALVVQHIFTEREAAIKQREELSFQINNLREQLSSSVSCCEQLEKEKEEVRMTLEALFQKLQEQHQNELQQLEERLKDFYSAEWDKTHEAYQREADKCRALMQQQVEDVRNKQEALRNQQEVAHAEQIATLKHEHETSLADLRITHEQDMQELDKTLKESEATLNEKIQTLTAENEDLRERLREEEERRRALADKSQKDAHTLYLEQELESLRAVLEIKTNQIHQQDKKLMQMDKLLDDNLKLEECLNKVQQENEDYKARMDKHAAISRQLSTEQAMLQQTLQKESKVNKRLSMENEELLWKLHNGDLCSPRRLSPSSPFPSPRNSASFSSTPVSPR